MNLAELLTNTVARRPDHPAVEYRGRSLSFSQLNQEVDALAHGLAGAGLAPGDVCVLMMPNSIEWITCYYALAKMGARVLPVNFLYRTEELKHIFRDSGAKGFIGHDEHLAYADGVLWDTPAITLRVAAGEKPPAGYAALAGMYQPGAGAFPCREVPDDEPLAIIYTSGTTGLPKGAVLSHHNLASNATTIGDMRYNEPHDICLGVLPLFHIYGQTSTLNSSIYLGLTLKLWEHFVAEEVFEAIEGLPSTFLIAVPTILNRLAEMAVATPPRRSGLRFCVSGGASLPVEILHRFEKAFNVTIYEGYGLTECSPVCVENPYGRQTKPGSIGVPIPGFSARVVDEGGDEVPREQVGELIIKGPGVMQGYLNQPEATAATIKDGWLYTGDLARMDEDGYIFIVDRKKEMIIRGGYNVYPREIEEVLYQHPAVLEAAVVGRPHDDLGEEVAAYVVARPDASADADEIRAFVKERVAPYKYPRIVSLVEELPKTNTGKILKRLIKAE